MPIHAPCLCTVCPTISTVPNGHQWHTLSLHILKGTHTTSPPLLGVFVLPSLSFLPPINFHRHHSHSCQSFFAMLAATFSSCQVAWRFPCHGLAGWSCCGSCLPLRDVHLEWGADRPDSPSPQGLCHVIQASPQALSSTPLFPLYTNEGMGLAFIFLANLRAIAETKKSDTPTSLPDGLS